MLTCYSFTTSYKRPLVATFLTILLTACGGGGDSSPTSKDWGTATLIETDNTGSAYLPRVAIDPNGNAIAVWAQSDGTRDNIWANRYDAVTGWGTATLIETDNAGNAGFPRVAIDPNGNAIAVWAQSDGTRNNIWANRYDAFTGWGTAILIETNDVWYASSPQVAFDTNGNALVVWNQSDGTRTNIWANRYDAVTGWGTAILIETDDAGSAGNQGVAFDPNGNALAVWEQSDGTRTNIWANRYDAVTGWGTATLIETDDSGDVNAPHVAFDPNGNAIAVWAQYDGTRFNIWANRYDAATGWGTATLIENDNAGSAGLPQVAFDADGNALAIWTQSDGVRWNIWANRYDAATSWGTATPFETNDALHASVPQIAFDPNGNALAVWEQFDDTRDNIWANRYDATTGWGTPTIIETDDTGDAGSPHVAIDANDNALAVWHQSDGTRSNIWANRYE